MNGTSSISTQPVVQAPIRDRAYWTSVIHNAAKVTPDSPRYGEARQVAQIAIQGLQELADSASNKDIKDIAPEKVGTAAVNFGHGASMGLAGNPTARTAMTSALVSSGNPLLAALSFGLNDPENYQQFRQLAYEANPKTAVIADILGAGSSAAIASPAVAGLTPARAGAILGGTMSATRGAADPTIFPGLSRTEAATLSGIGGAVGGALLAKFIAAGVGTVQTIGKTVSRLLGRTATPEEIAQVTESAIRSRLGKLNVRQDVIDRAVESWKANGTLIVKAPPPPPTVRPGETITATENLDKATFLRRGGTVRQDTSPISGNRSMSFDPGKGQTLPWYPRGGQVEQSVAPFPASAPAGAAVPNQTGAFLNYLKQAANPQDALARLGTIRDLGIQISPEDQTQMLQLLFGAQR